MFDKSILKWLVLLCVWFAFFVSIGVYRGGYQGWYFGVWLGTQLLFPVVTWIYEKTIFKLNWKKVFTALLICLLPVLLRETLAIPGRINGDDINTAYFTVITDWRSINMFSGIPADKLKWVSQFPVPFFLFQKIFFNVFGENFDTVRRSVLPYVYIVSLGVYYIADKWWGWKAAVAAVVFYAFLAPSMYLETLGLHFVSSTAIFTVFAACVVAFLYKPDRTTAAAAGLAAGWCYLFYITSYIALGVLGVAWLAVAVKNPRDGFRLFIWSTIGAMLVLGPFVGYALGVDNYFGVRMGQVKFVPSEAISPARSRPMHLKATIRSMYTPGIGGAGGYNFGGQAFLEPVSLALLSTGLILVLYRTRGGFFVPVTLLGAFTAAAVSAWPPAFHRMSLGFPALALAMAASVHHQKKLLLNAGWWWAVAVILTYTAANLDLWKKMAYETGVNHDISLARHLTENFPDRTIRMAAFPGYVFERMYRFFPGSNRPILETDYHANLLNRFTPDEKYVYAMIYAEEFGPKFQAMDPVGKLYRYSDVYSIFAN